MRASNRTPRECLFSALCLVSLFASEQAAGAEARWRQLPLFGGPVLSVAAAPSDPGVVYAASYGGGLFRSDDGGALWASTGATAAMRGYGEISVSPFDPLDVAFATARFPQPPHWSRSRDGGATWERVTVAASDEAGVLGVTYDPTIPRRLYARTRKGLFRSTDDGRSWSRLAFANARVGRLYIDPQNAERLIALVYFPRGSALLWSVNGGATWTEKASSAFFDGFVAFAVDPIHSQTIYVTDGAGLLVSEDDGASFVETALNFLTGITDLATTPSGTLVVSRFYGIVRSVDHAETFERNRTGDEFHRLAVGADGTIYAAADFGIWRSRNDGEGWRLSHRGVTAQYVFGLAASGGPRPSLLAAGKGLFRGTAQGESWSRVPEASGIGFFNPFFPPYRLTFSPVDPKLAFAVLDGGVFRSPDAGVSWRKIAPLQDYVLGQTHSHRFAFAFDPRDPLKVYFFAGFEVSNGGPHRTFSFYSADGGETWIRRTRAPEIASVAIDPHRTDTLIGATASGLLRSDDRGIHWRPIAPEVPKPAVVAFDPRGTLYAGTESEGVWASRDGGAAFRPLGRGLDGARIASLLADPTRPGRLFAAVGGRGVFVWEPGAAAWKKLALDFPTAAFVEGLIALDPSGEGALYAATFGRGVYRLDLGDL